MDSGFHPRQVFGADWPLFVTDLAGSTVFRRYYAPPAHFAVKPSVFYGAFRPAVPGSSGATASTGSDAFRNSRCRWLRHFLGATGSDTPFPDGPHLCRTAQFWRRDYAPPSSIYKRTVPLQAIRSSSPSSGKTDSRRLIVKPRRQSTTRSAGFVVLPCLFLRVGIPPPINGQFVSTVLKTERTFLGVSSTKWNRLFNRYR